MERQNQENDWCLKTTASFLLLSFHLLNQNGTEVTVLIRSFLSEENMNTKFGAKQPTGTPSLAWSCVVVIVSLLAGASVVHNIYKPDL
ncbi:hypothetical protein CISIN_1g043329mg, partial [Citrus sinensis]